MELNNFRKVAYPKELESKELTRGIVWKFQRILGVFVAYLFSKLGIQANVIDLLRVFLSIAALYFLSKLKNGYIIFPIIGVVLLYIQVFLDFVDGAVARASGKTSVFGEELDALPNALSRSIILILFGIFTGNIFFIILSIFTSYILIYFFPNTSDKISNTGFMKFVKYIYGKGLSVIVMLILLPLLIVVCALIDLPLVMCSNIILGIYIFLSVLWIVICVFKR